mmetsp:Transcript_44727/g.118658  ORF Transcript_44727/g.118658 Transcript_44727/m.118658 type:complete len:814 (-) Transcript_44727:242-2683(-)
MDPMDPMSPMLQCQLEICLAQVHEMETSLAVLRQTLTCNGAKVKAGNTVWKSCLASQPEFSRDSIERHSTTSYQTSCKSLDGAFPCLPSCGDFLDEAIRHEDSDEASSSSSSEEEAPELEFSVYSWFFGAKELIKHAPTLHPDHKIRIFWNLFGLLCILFEAFNIPLVLAFDYEATGLMLAVLAFVDLYFILDLPMNFLTGYVAENGKVVMSKRKIASRYFTRGCLCDFLSAIPWEWLPIHENGFYLVTKNFPIMKATRLIKFTRLLHLMREGMLSVNMEMLIEANPYFFFATGILRLLLLLGCVTHWCACAWYWVGWRGQQHSWIHQYLGDTSDTTTQYVYSVYFTLTTMTTVGYGDISAQNFDEVLFVLVLLVIASVFFAGLMGSLVGLIDDLNRGNSDISANKLMLSRYRVWRVVPDKLFLKVRQHLLYMWESNDCLDEYEEQIKDNLPPLLRKELCFHIYGGFLRQTPFLAWMKGYEVCLEELGSLIQSKVFCPGDWLFRVGEKHDAMVVLISGKVCISQNEPLHKHTEYFEVHNTAFQQQVEEAAAEQRRRKVLSAFSKKFSEKKVSKHNVHNAASTTNANVEPMIQKFSTYKVSAAMHFAEDRKVPTIRGASLFVSQPYLIAATLLQAEDVKAVHAATRIQRSWRKRRRPLFQAMHNEGGSSVATRKVEAPAYFGDSCLWFPLHEWDEESSQLRHKYGARVEHRSEVLVIPRSAVKEVIDHFSPWLEPRFEQFRLSVLKAAERSQQRKGTASQDVDRAMEDVDAMMTASRRRTVRKSVRASFLVPAELREPLLSRESSNSSMKLQAL